MKSDYPTIKIEARLSRSQDPSSEFCYIDTVPTNTLIIRASYSFDTEPTWMHCEFIEEEIDLGLLSESEIYFKMSGLLEKSLPKIYSRIMTYRLKKGEQNEK